MNDPTQTNEAELALLGATLSGWRYPSELDIEPGDFYHPRHQAIWAAILDLEEAGNVPDPAATVVALDGHQPPIDPMFVMGLTNAAPVHINAPYYADQVRTAAGLREIQTAGIAIQQIGSTFGPLEERREEARQRIDVACRSRSAPTARTIGDLLEETLDRARNGRQAVLPTGWHDIDRIIGGVAPGRLVVFGARPGGGKSIACTNLAIQMAHKHRHGVLLASLEMPGEEVMQRLISAHASVNLTAIANSNLAEEDWRKIERVQGEINSWPLRVEDPDTLTVQGLRRLARDFRREHHDLALIIVDYLQLMSPAAGGRRNMSRAEEISQISRDLKRLARETGACVVAAAQVNRDGGRSDTGPKLTDLRDGGIENDADVVLLFHRPDLDLPTVNVSIAKNRHGAQSNLDLNLIGHYARLSSVAWTPPTTHIPPDTRSLRVVE